MINQICDLTFLSHAETIQHGYSQFGGKGISNSYYLYSHIEYKIDINANLEIEANCRLMHHSHHTEFHPAGICYNSRIYSSLGAFRDTLNKLMHTKRMFQANGYRINQYLSSECFKYIVYKCKGKCVLEDRKVDRVRRIFLSDLAQEKRKFLNQTLTVIRIETADQLKYFHTTLGSTIGTGARVTSRLKDGILPVRLHSVINEVYPPDNETLKKIKISKKRKCADPDRQYCDDDLICGDRKYYLIQISFDQTTSVAAIAVVFTCMIVGEENCCVNVLSDIAHNILVDNLTSVDLVVGTLFLYDDKRWMVEEIDGDDVTASNNDDVVIFF